MDWYLWRMTVHPKMQVWPSELDTWSMDELMDAHELLDALDEAESRARAR